jgi:hypothetical protein
MSDNLRSMLVDIKRRLKESQERGNLALSLGYTEVLNMADELGIRQDEGVDIARRLLHEGYLVGTLTNPYTTRRYTRARGHKAPFAVLKVVELTPKGRQEIGG